MGAFVIQDVKQSGFYIILTCFSLVSSFYFLFLPTPTPIVENKEKEESVDKNERGEIR